MPSRAAQFSSRLMEAGVLAAVIVVPLFFNVWSNRVFEPDKLTLLRSIALLMSAAGVVLWLERGGGLPDMDRIKGWLRVPLVLPVVLVTLSMALSTGFSRAPTISLLGSYNRLQGLYTWLAYVVVFGAILILIRKREQVDRLILALILPSMPAALYAVVQRFGLDPMPWLGNVTRRIASTMGNSIFIAAYLIMVVPLTVVKLADAMRDLDEEESSAAVLRVAGYLVLLFIQLLAIVLSQSRGPLLGLVGGLFFLMLLLAAYRGRKAMLTVLGVGGAVAAFLIVFNLPGSPLAPLREVPYIGRLGQVFEVGSGTGRVRVLIWGGALDLIASDPARAVIGHGPETMHMVYNPYYPPELGNLESRNASPDRSHNEMLDALVQTGIIGFLAYMLLFTSLFYYGLRWLGLIDDARQRNLFLGLFFGGGFAAAAGFRLWAGDWTFLGVSAPAGMIAGLMLYVVVQALQGGEAPRTPSRLLVAGLLAGLIAHFIEIHFGIAIAATRTLFFAMTGLLVVVGALSASRPGLLAVDEDAEETPSSGRRRGRRGRRAARSGFSPSTGARWLSSGWLVLLILITLTFDFVVRDFTDLGAAELAEPERAQMVQDLFVLLWLLSLTWLLGLLVAGSERWLSVRQRGSGRGGLWLMVLVTLLGMLGYGLVHWMALASGADAGTTSGMLMLYYVTLFGVLFAWSATLVRNDPHPGQAVQSKALWLYPLLAIAVVTAVLLTNVNVVRADIWYKQAFAGYHATATQAQNRGQMEQAQANYQAAFQSYDRALELNEGEDYYLLFKGKALLERADATAASVDRLISQEGLGSGGSEYEAPPLASAVRQRDQQFEDALTVLERAYEVAPLNTDHSANLARAYQIWGDRTLDAQLRAERLAESERWFVGDESAGIPGAIGLSPNNAGLYRELATTHYLAGDTDAALETIDRALEIDPEFKLPLRLRATIWVEEGSQAAAAGDDEAAREAWERALADYRSYLESREGRNDATAWSGLSLVLARLGRTDEAREANQRVLEIAPGDLDTLRNLAILERDAGNPEAACQWVTEGLRLHPSDSGLTQLADMLQCQVPSESPGTSP